MKHRNLGRTGLKVSEICLGTMTFAGQTDEEESFRILDSAADRGVTFIDTADMYPIPPDPATAGRTEEVIGRWLARRADRDQFVIATKCRLRTGNGPNDQGLSRRHVHRACEASLKRLGIETIDLYQTHMPDWETPLEETLRALDDLVAAGKVRYLGCSNEPSWRVAMALGISRNAGWNEFVSVQPRYNLLYREAEGELMPLCRDQGLGVMAYNPLAGGFLTGKYAKPELSPPPGTRFTLGVSGELYRERYWQEAQFEAVQFLSHFCEERSVHLATASVAWVLAQPGISCAIVGASHARQLDATLAATDFTIDMELREALDSAWWTLPRRPESR